ncbi:MAG: hypothetical protein M3Y57_12095 [Acidobacteriota bacterium]|nr:hypothetical protein [Acidobacteriota bacterium]
MWRDDRVAFDQYQRIQEFGNRSRFGDASYWASFAGTELGETVFLGLYRVTFKGGSKEDTPRPHRDGVDAAGCVDVYDLVKTDLLSDFEGTLFIDWGAGTRSWIQRPDNQNKTILELRKGLLT